MLYYVIIVVISLWLFWCLIKLLTCFTSCFLDRNLLVTLYLSFYYLLYLEGLMCFVLVLLLFALPWGSNVFCASISGYRYICSKFIIAPMIHDRGSDMIRGVRAWSKGEYYCWRTGDRKGLCLCYVFILCGDLYPCCFCKFLGFVFMHL